MADNKEKKPNIFKRIAKFWRDYASELKKVVWMSWKDVRKNAFLVIVCAVIISAVIGLLDLGLSKAITALGALI